MYVYIYIYRYAGRRVQAGPFRAPTTDTSCGAPRQLHQRISTNHINKHISGDIQQLAVGRWVPQARAVRGRPPCRKSAGGDRRQTITHSQHDALG